MGFHRKRDVFEAVIRKAMRLQREADAEKE